MKKKNRFFFFIFKAYLVSLLLFFSFSWIFLSPFSVSLTLFFCRFNKQNLEEKEKMMKFVLLSALLVSIVLSSGYDCSGGACYVTTHASQKPIDQSLVTYYIPNEVL